MKELTVISGKGGTGKTSMVAAFASLSGRIVCADCDVDAANLHLVTDPSKSATHRFFGGQMARIDREACVSCGKCLQLCRFNGVMEASGSFSIDRLRCEGCGVCAEFCPAGAISMEPEQNGEWYVSDTGNGPLVHARLFPGSENSGKLVTEVRNGARAIALQEGIDTVMVDGSPGTGCPVIASVAGTDAVLAVTEPGRAAIHDLMRVVELTGHFGIYTMVVVNRADINEDLTAEVSAMARAGKFDLAGRVRFDEGFTKAQMCGKSITDFQSGGAAADVAHVWEKVSGALGSKI